MSLKNLFFILILCVSELAFSAERMGQARLFLGSTQTKPTELNTELTVHGLKNVTLNNQFGVEITFPIMTYLNLGLRYSKRVISQDEELNPSSTEYKAEVDQDVADFVARVPFYQSDYVKFDAVIGAGGLNTKYSIKTAGQDGALEKKGSPFATAHSFAGVSMGIGKGKYYFILEAGYDMNKVDNFERSGTINNTINTIDLSGSYFTLGFMFDGIPISMK